MASGKAQYWSWRLLNMLNGATGTIATPLFLALYTVAPTLTTAGTEVTNAGSYASFSITGNTTNWPTISSGSTMSSGTIFFGVTAATADWSSAANIVAAALKDSGTNGAGNQYYFGALTEAKPVLNGDTPSFAVGAVTIQEL
jgi:hypothetical protein